MGIIWNGNGDVFNITSQYNLYNLFAKDPSAQRSKLANRIYTIYSSYKSCIAFGQITLNLKAVLLM